MALSVRLLFPKHLVPGFPPVVRVGGDDRKEPPACRRQTLGRFRRRINPRKVSSMERPADDARCGV